MTLVLYKISVKRSFNHLLIILAGLVKRQGCNLICAGKTLMLFYIKDSSPVFKCAKFFIILIKFWYNWMLIFQMVHLHLKYKLSINSTRSWEEVNKTKLYFSLLPDVKKMSLSTILIVSFYWIIPLQYLSIPHAADYKMMLLLINFCHTM